MKTLIESLFDDNIKKDILFGDILELEEWECVTWSDESIIDIVMNSNFKDRSTLSFKKIREVVKKPEWKSFLDPFKSYYLDGSNFADNDEKYLYNICFYCFTWVVMCCKTIKEIKEKLTKFINASKNSKAEINAHERNEPIEKIEVVPLEGLGDMKGIPRLVVIKFKIKGKDIIIYMKLKKRD